MPKPEDRLVDVTLPARVFIICDTDEGGYRAGHCLACKASGWFPLKHKKSCPVGQVIDGVPTSDRKP